MVENSVSAIGINSKQELVVVKYDGKVSISSKSGMHSMVTKLV